VREKEKRRTIIKDRTKDREEEGCSLKEQKTNKKTNDGRTTGKAKIRKEQK
jgi:hypothetical protein